MKFTLLMKDIRKCVTVNHCWFVDETDKKPIEFDYGQYSPNEIPQSKRGMYHPNCHCRKLAIPNPKAEDIELLPLDKFNDFFNRKQGLFFAWGYNLNDIEEFVSVFCQKVKESYSLGQYNIFEHTNAGVKINCFITVDGKGIKTGHKYAIKSGWIIFPDGKLRGNTIYAGKNDK